MSKVVVMVGTRKGAFSLTSDAAREKWALKGPFVGGIDINHAVIDPRNGKLFATANDPWFGPTVRSSTDMGETWTDAKQSPRFAEDPKPAPGDETPWFLLPNQVIERCWHIQPGRASEPNVMYCGVGPAALFRSEDNGDT